MPYEIGENSNYSRMRDYILALYLECEENAQYVNECWKTAQAAKVGVEKLAFEFGFMAGENAYGYIADFFSMGLQKLDHDFKTFDALTKFLDVQPLQDQYKSGWKAGCEQGNFVYQETH